MRWLGWVIRYGVWEFHSLCVHLYTFFLIQYGVWEFHYVCVQSYMFFMARKFVTSWFETKFLKIWKIILRQFSRRKSIQSSLKQWYDDQKMIKNIKKKYGYNANGIIFPKIIKKNWIFLLVIFDVYGSFVITSLIYSMHRSEILKII